MKKKKKMELNILECVVGRWWCYLNTELKNTDSELSKWLKDDKASFDIARLLAFNVSFVVLATEWNHDDGYKNY